MSLKHKNNRPLISLMMLVGFLVILITGLMSYALRYDSILSAVHSVFGITFVLIGVLHLKNNLKPMLAYLKPTGGKRTLSIIGGSALIAIVLTVLGLPPMQTIVDAGYALKELRPSDRQLRETIYTQLESAGRELSIDIKTGQAYSGPGATVLGVTITGVPQMAIWLEDLDGNYLETLYVTKKASNDSYIQSWLSGSVRSRPEALPHWSHSSTAVQSKLIVDAITGATPLSDYEVQTRTSVDQQQVIVKLEVNRSFDFNSHYHKNAFPDDAVYSGSGASAQPSLIYGAEISLDKSTEKFKQYNFLSLLGRGHHSGKDGEIHQDLSGVTTAKDIVKRIIVEVL